MFPRYKTFHDFVLCSFISSQMTYTMSNGKTLGLFLPSGKSCLSSSCASSVLFGLHLKTQCGKYLTLIFRMHVFNFQL